MRTIPKTRIGRIEFYENRVPLWKSHAAEIGLQVGLVDTLKTKTSNARLAYNDLISARAAAKAALEKFISAESSMAKTGSEALEGIRYCAKSTHNPNVYVVAQIPPPKDPAPIAPPGIPFDIRAELAPDGSVVLRWQCKNPPGSAGTRYDIRRQVGGGSMSLIDTVGRRRFVDQTLAAGAPVVYYEITAVRSTLRSPAQTIVVQFGAGGLSTTAVQSPPLPRRKAG